MAARSRAIVDRHPRARAVRASARRIGGAKPRADIAIGMRVFHEKFGYGEIIDIDGNKLEVEFEQAGAKRVLDGFVRTA